VSCGGAPSTAALQLDKSTTSRIIAGMERSRLIEWSRPEYDQREKHIMASREGKKRYTRMRTAIVRQNEELLAEYSPAGRKAVIKALQQLLHERRIRFARVVAVRRDSCDEVVDRLSQTPRIAARRCTSIAVLATITPPGSLTGLFGTKSVVPSRLDSTLCVTIARIIQTAAFTFGHSIARHPSRSAGSISGDAADIRANRSAIALFCARAMCPIQ
jgi:hypothetical protein